MGLLGYQQGLMGHAASLVFHLDSAACGSPPHDAERTFGAGFMCSLIKAPLPPGYAVLITSHHSSLASLIRALQTLQTTAVATVTKWPIIVPAYFSKGRMGWRFPRIMSTLEEVGEGVLVR